MQTAGSRPAQLIEVMPHRLDLLCIIRRNDLGIPRVLRLISETMPAKRPDHSPDGLKTS